MAQQKLVGSDYVMGALGVSRASAYRIIRDLNSELEESGIRTLAGKVSLPYLEARFFTLPMGEEEPNGSEP